MNRAVAIRALREFLRLYSEQPKPILSMPPRVSRYSKVRGRGGRAAMSWEKYTNDYQRELAVLFSEMLNELEEDLETEDESLREELALAWVGRLETSMSSVGRSAILGAGGVGAEPFTARTLDIVDKHIRNNEQFIAGSLGVDLRSSVVELLGAGLLASAVRAKLQKSFGSRVEQYSGEVWSTIQEAAAVEALAKTDPRIYWRLDPQAEHCSDCLQHGEREYENFVSMLALTGDAMPGSGVQCDGNCRCMLDTVQEDGEFGRA